jgi:hypothetical protein
MKRYIFAEKGFDLRRMEVGVDEGGPLKEGKNRLLSPLKTQPKPYHFIY